MVVRSKVCSIKKNQRIKEKLGGRLVEAIFQIQSLGSIWTTGRGGRQQDPINRRLKTGLLGKPKEAESLTRQGND